MVVIHDRMTRWVHEIHETGVRALCRAGSVNGIILYEGDGGQRVVPLDLEVALRSRLRHRPLVEDAAHLMGLATDAFEDAVAAAGTGKGPFPRGLGRLWFGTVLRRLRAIKPRYYVVSGETHVVSAMTSGAVVAEAETLAKGNRLREHPACEDALATTGFTPIRCYQILTPFRRSPEGPMLGEKQVRDSMAGGGWVRGVIGSVYAPSES